MSSGLSRIPSGKGCQHTILPKFPQKICIKLKKKKIGPCGQTDASENITIPHTTYAFGKQYEKQNTYHLQEHQLIRYEDGTIKRF